MFWNGRTAIDGLSGSGSGFGVGVRGHHGGRNRPKVTHRFCCVHAHGAIDVLEALLTQLGELDRDLAANLIVGGRRDADATGRRDALKPRCDVDTVPENVVALDQDVSEIDPDPEEQPAIKGHPFVPLSHHGLHRDRTLDRIDHRRKFKQHPVPRALHEASPVLLHEGIGNLAVFAESAGRADLVEPHEARVARNFSRDYGGEPASDTSWLLWLHTEHILTGRLPRVPQ